MNFKVEQIFGKNFKDFENFEVTLNGKTTTLVGVNGSGKSTIIQAFRLALERAVKLGDKVVPKKTWKAELIGKHGKSTEVGVILKDYGINFDVKVEFKFTKSSEELKITASDGRKLDEEFLNGIFSELCFNPDKFFLSTGKEQAKMLGVDTSEIDEEIKQHETEHVSPARIRKHDAKTELESMEEPEKVERVNVSEIIRQKQEIDEFNYDMIGKEYDLGKVTKMRMDVIDQIENLNKSLERLTAQQTQIQDSIEPKKDSTEITEKLNSAESINRKADQYDRYVEKKTAFETACKTWDQVNEKKKELDEKRKAILTEQLPFRNMSIDDQGGLLVEGKTFNENNFNYAQLWEKSIKIISKINPELKTIYIKNPHSLDRAEDGRIEILQDLEKGGFQFIPEVVSPVADKGLENAILIKNSKVVSNEI